MCRGGAGGDGQYDADEGRRAAELPTELELARSSFKPAALRADAGWRRCSRAPPGCTPARNLLCPSPAHPATPERPYLTTRVPRRRRSHGSCCCDDAELTSGHARLHRGWAERRPSSRTTLASSWCGQPMKPPLQPPLASSHITRVPASRGGIAAQGT